MRDKLFMALIALVLAGFAGQAWAVTGNDYTGTGNWTNAANWSAGVPDFVNNPTNSAIDDFYQVRLGDNDHVTVNTVVVPQSTQIQIGRNGTASLTITNGFLRVADDQVLLLGNNNVSDSTLNIQNGGILVSGGGANIAAGNSPNNVVNLESGGIWTNNGSVINVGNKAGGTGTLNINGGSLVSSEEIQVANGAADPAVSKGVFNLNSGTVTTYALEVGSGDGSDGMATIAGGTLTLTGNNRTLAGSGAGATGIVNVAGGAVIIGSDAVANQRIGNGGTGIMNISSGSVTTVDGDLVIGYAAGGKGVVNVSDSGTLNVATAADNIFVGANSAASVGEFNLSGGAVNTGSRDIIIGDGGSKGTMTVSGGTHAMGNIVVGSSDSGDGKLVITGGTNTTLSTVQLGAGIGATAGFVVSNGATWLMDDLKDGDADNITADVSVIGAGTVLRINDDTNVGDDINMKNSTNGTGTITIDGGGALVVGGQLEAAGWADGNVLTLKLLEGELSVLAINGEDDTLPDHLKFELEKGFFVSLASPDGNALINMATNGAVSWAQGNEVGFGVAMFGFDGTADFSSNIVDGALTHTLYIENGLSWAGDDAVAAVWVETIPEPATIGMMVAFSAGLFFVRRRLMI